MNNIEKNLSEIYSEFFYHSNLNELLIYLNTKFERITKSGFSDGLSLDKETEKELIHRLLLEGVPFYLFEKLKQTLKNFEESISEQPMLHAHPRNVTKPELLDIIPSTYISNLLKNDYMCLDFKVYPDISEYELFNQFKYLYLENHFEENKTQYRSEYVLKFSCSYFKNSKHTQIAQIAQLLYYIPYELNAKYENFCLQTNEYMTCSYFKNKEGFINMVMDSNMKSNLDTGKKITFMIILFPDELELSQRKLTIKLKRESSESEDIINLEVSKPLSAIVFKTRIFGFEIEKQNFDFFILFYYIHGPIDKQFNM
jgi:hypothetical protein